MLTPAQLPRHLHVGRAIQFVVVDIGAVRERPFSPRLEVGQPRQPWAEVARARTKQIKFMTNERFSAANRLFTRATIRGIKVVGDTAPITVCQ